MDLDCGWNWKVYGKLGIGVAHMLFPDGMIYTSTTQSTISFKVKISWRSFVT